MAVVSFEAELVDGLHGHIQAVAIRRHLAERGRMLAALDGDVGEMFHEESRAKT